MYMLACGGYVLWGSMQGGFEFWYYPAVRGDLTGPLTVSMYIVYTCLIGIPIFVHARDGIRQSRTRTADAATACADGQGLR